MLTQFILFINLLLSLRLLVTIVKYHVYLVISELDGHEEQALFLLKKDWVQDELVVDQISGLLPHVGAVHEVARKHLHSGFFLTTVSGLGPYHDCVSCHCEGL